MSNAIPQGWRRQSLIDLGAYENGFAFNDRHWSELGLPIVRIAQITGSQGIVDRYPGRLPDTFRIDTGDLIFSWSGTLAVVRWTGGPAWLNQHLFKVVPDASVDEALLFHLLQASVAEMSKRTHGSTMKHIKRGELREFFVNLPVDRDEQRKLANVLDTLDTTIHETEAIIAKLKAVKQGLLEDLLTRGIDSNGELRPPQSQAPHLYKDSPLGWIPVDWKVCTLDEFCISVADGTHDSPKPCESGYPLVTSKNLIDGKLDLSDCYLISESDYRAVIVRSFVAAGDILFGMIGTIGSPALIEPGQEHIATKNVGLLRLGGDFCRAHFLKIFLSFERAEKQLSEAMAGSTQRFIGLGTLRSILVPEIEPAEMKKIVEAAKKVDDRLKVEVELSKKLRLQKHGLSHDLFAGRVRVTSLLTEAQHHKGDA